MRAMCFTLVQFMGNASSGGYRGSSRTEQVGLHPQHDLVILVGRSILVVELHRLGSGFTDPREDLLVGWQLLGRLGRLGA